VNVSNDTDTVATIVGAITGTMAGVAGVPADWRELVETVNKLDLRGLAGRLAAAAA
jgi:ADP-ribosylglycohydrolase